MGLGAGGTADPLKGRFVAHSFLSAPLWKQRAPPQPSPTVAVDLSKLPDADP